MGLLDYINSNLGGFGGLLNGAYLQGQAPEETKLTYDALGNPIGQQYSNAALSSPFPTLSQPSTTPPPMTASMAPIFGFGPNGFGSQAPAGMSLPPSIQPPAAPAPAPQPAAAPPTDVSAQNAQPNRTMDIGGYQMPQFGNPAPQVTTPAAAQPAQFQPQNAAPDSVGFGDRLNAGFQGFANAGGPLQALGNLVQGLSTGQRTDPQGMQQQTLSATYQSLVSSGVPKNLAMAAALNPEVLKQIAPAYFDKAPKLQETGTDPLTGQKTFAQQVFKDGKLTLEPVTANSGQPAASSATTMADFQKAQAAGVTGAALYDHLPQQIAPMVRAMIEGRQPLPSAQALRNPATLALIDAAHAIDPTFDATSWASRQAGVKDFTSGKSSEMVRAANQTLAHVGSLLDSMDALKNGKIPALNAAGNFLSEQTGDGRQGSFRTNAHAVAEEMSKVFKGANLSDAEIRQWEQNLTENMSPAQQKAQVAKLSELLHGSLHALEEKRTAAIGPMAADKAGPIIKAEGQKTLDRIDNWVKGNSPQAASSIQEGATATNPKTGQTITFRNGKWQ